MDNKKDIRNTQNYFKGQETKSFDFKEPIVSPLVSIVEIKDIEIRIEKIAVAVLLVVSLIQKDSSVRLGIEDEMIKLVRLSRSLHTANVNRKEEIIVEMITGIHILLSIFNIAETIGSVSRMNSAIVKEQLSLISAKVVELRNNERNYEDYLFQINENKAPINFGDLFAIKEDNIHITQRNVHKGHLINKGQDVFNNISIKSNTKDNVIKDKIRNDLSFRMGRRNIILNIIKDKGEVTIKDITNVITDCSEKTIQRELISMVSENVLNKTGEKRWSRYSFKK